MNKEEQIQRITYLENTVHTLLEVLRDSSNTPWLNTRLHKILTAMEAQENEYQATNDS